MASRKPADPKPDTKPEPAPDAGPATTHRYTNTFPLIFPDLHHGDVHVVRANPHVDDDGNPAPEVGIIILHTGDEITLPDGYEHTWLTPINQPDKEQQS